MKSNATYIFLFVLAVVSGLSAQSGCPGCQLDLPADMAEDTIFIGETPNATYNSYYEADLSFRLPMTTTPVANSGGSVPPNLNINRIDIVQVRNLPPGLSWEASNTSFDVSNGETDGCVRFCGTPLAVDSFSIEVVLSANLFIFSQETSVFVPLVVEPATSSNGGFSLVNPSGCNSVTVDFINNVPSNGADGYSYSWNFGNDSISTEENPGSQTYNSEGVYPISYEAIIDTAGYFLTSVTVLETSCIDLLGNRPDLKVNVFNPDDEYIHTSDIVFNTSLPVSYSMLLPIGEGTYRMQIVDDDGGLDGADDDCGSVLFTRDMDGTFTVGDLTLSFTLFHPVDTVRGVDTVVVYKDPALPIFAELPSSSFCPEDSVRLEVTNYSRDLNWFLDSASLNLPDTQTVYYASTPGEYMVRYINSNGCLSQAIAPVFDFYPPLDTIAIETFGNLIQGDSSALAPDAYFVWELNGEQIDEDRMRFCATQSGVYTLIVFDAQTRCTSRSNVVIDVDPNVFCDIVSTEEQLSMANWQLFPNPGNGPVTISGGLESATDLQLQLVDVTGRVLRKQNVFANAGDWQFTWPDLQLTTGVYYVLISNDHETVSLPLVRQ